MKEIEYWIKSEDSEEMFSSNYWNNIENEKEKEWWIEDSKDKKVFNFLKKSGLSEEFTIAIKDINLRGKILDLAAGTCWTSAILSKYENVEFIDAVEFSHHRIAKLAPITIESLGGDMNKINRIYGSFYDIKREDNYYDFIILSQAYHHAEFPLKLFHECDRVLKKGGKIIIIGEHIIGFKTIIRRFIKNLLKMKINFNIMKEFYHHDDPLGDHFYMEHDYAFTFFAYGYSYEVIKTNLRDSTVFIGTKNK